MIYRGELCRAMQWLGEREDILFLGQAVGRPGTAMYGTLKGVPESKRIELPVAEEMQLGMCIGLALQGHVPICIYPRWNFLLLAMNQLVNHLDKLPQMGYKPGVIIRVGIGSEHPLDPGPQHRGDFTFPMQCMIPNIRVARLEKPEEVLDNYVLAYDVAKGGRSTILVEVSDYYDEGYRKRWVGSD